jgi:hypothetical protein
MRSSLLLFALFTLSFTTARASDHLLLCVVTARRARSYLPQAVAALKGQGGNFVVVDVDNSTLPSMVGAVVRLDAQAVECTESGRVSCAVQQQASDVVRALEACGGMGGSKWVALVEDDMLACDRALVTMENVLSKLHRFKTARFARFSRAVVFPSARIAAYAAFVRARIHETPYDILLNFDDWAPGIDYIHHQSLFAHMGAVSTVEERNDPAFIAKYGSLRDEACGSALVGK